AIALEDAGFWTRPDGEAVCVLEQRSAWVADRRVALPANLARVHGARRHAVGRSGMGVEEAGGAGGPRPQTLGELERREKAPHGARVVARSGAQELAVLVRLSLHITGVGCHLASANPRQRQRARAERDRLLTRGVATHDVSNLVAHHAGELVLVIRQEEEPTRY